MKIKNLSLIFIFFFFEFLRDYFFINTNLYIEYLENLESGLNVFNYTDSSVLKIIKNLQINSLIQLKWTMSVFFASIFFGLGILFSNLNFEESSKKKFLKFYSFGGGFILISSLIIYLTGNLLSVENKFNFYYVSLELSHFVQSSLYPIVFLLIFLAFNKRIISS